MSAVDVLTAHGMSNAADLVAAADATGVPLWIAAAFTQKESNGRNVYGGDTGGVFATTPRTPVTEENYREFYRLVVDEKQKSNGVGPMQITYPAYFPQAQAEGLKLWVPLDNFIFGLRIVARHLAGDYSVASLERAGTLYNKGNLRDGVNAYGRDLAVKAAAWRALLLDAPDSTEGVAMPDLWMPGALRLESTRRNTLNGNGFRILTWHTFEAKYSLTVTAALRYLIANGSEAFVFHPLTGQWGQCQPMSSGARTLKSTTATPTNRFGTVHQQVEVIAYAANPWTSDLTPAGKAGLQRGIDFFRSWGIPDQWAWRNQPPPKYPGGSVRRRLPEQSGHAYHSGWPVNDHGDPGAIAAPWTLGGSVSDPTRPRLGDRSDLVRVIQHLLTQHGYTLDLDGVFGPATDIALRDFQARQGLDVDGIAGPATMAALRVPPVVVVPPAEPEPEPAPDYRDQPGFPVWSYRREGEDRDASQVLADIAASVARIEATLAPKEPPA